jgi:glycosyltransferase involved in cell wall biosynthesis
LSITVHILGGFPPPVTGAAKNNALFAQDLSDRGYDVRILNTSGPTISHARGRGYHFSRAKVNLNAAARILFGTSGPVYIVPDGGWGVIYTTFHCILAKIRNRKIVLHHRTFLYIDNYNRFVSIINKLCGNSAINVFLSEGMKNKFVDKYRTENNIVVGNSHYVELTNLRTNIKQKYSIGHLSNLCREKGFFDVCELFDRISGRISQATLHLAGPVVEAEVQERIDYLKSKYGDRVQYYGPLYGEGKQQFYDRCRFFMFPTRYPLEAAPNVVYEALAAGCVVMATTNGCIPEMLLGVRGKSIPIENFVDTAIEAIVSTLKDDGVHDRAVKIRDDLQKEIVEDKLRYERMVEMLTDRDEKYNS